LHLYKPKGVIERTIWDEQKPFVVDNVNSIISNNSELKTTCNQIYFPLEKKLPLRWIWFILYFWIGFWCKSTTIYIPDCFKHETIDIVCACASALNTTSKTRKETLKAYYFLLCNLFSKHLLLVAHESWKVSLAKFVVHTVDKLTS
jgi:hypothetical protein